MTGWPEKEAELRTRYHLDDAQVAWYRHQYEDVFRGDMAALQEKYPSCAEEAFRAAGDLVFESLKASLFAATKLPRGQGGRLIETTNGVRLDPSDHGPLEIFEPFEPGEQYVMASDVSEGRKEREAGRLSASEEFDPYHTCSACAVRRVNGWVLGATYLCQEPPDVFTNNTMLLACMYGDPLWAIEIPGPGHDVIARANERGYPCLYAQTYQDQQDEWRQDKVFGFRNTERTRAGLIGGWMEFIREEPDKVRSPILAGQALNFIHDRKTGRPGPKPGQFVDLLFADMICVQVLRTHRPAASSFVRKFNREQDQGAGVVY